MIWAHGTRGKLLLMCMVVACALPASARAAALYDQTDHPDPSGNHASNDYNPPDDDWENQIADDFTVPGGQSWQVSHVDVLGVVDPGSPPSTVNVFLYSNAGTLPGTELFRATGIAASSQPNYSIPVTGAPDLTPGTYWVSVQQAGSMLGATQWFWNERSVQSGSPAVIRAPGGHVSPACTGWVTLVTCFSGGPPDMLFKLSGTAAPYPPPPPLPSNLLTLGKPKLNKKKGTATQPVTVPGPGVLTLTGKGVVTRRPARASASRAVSAAGTVNLLVKPKGKAKRKLNSTGRAKVKVTITFVPTGGSPNAQTKTIKLKKSLR